MIRSRLVSRCALWLLGVVLLTSFGPWRAAVVAQQSPVATVRGDFAETIPAARAMVQMRDRWFLLHPWGRACVDFYYAYSPYAAFAVEQEGRGNIRVLAGGGIVGLRWLFHTAVVWVPLLGALAAVWLSAAATAILQRLPGPRDWLRRHHRRVLGGAVGAFALLLGAIWFHPDAVAKRTRIAEIRAAFERREFAAELIASCSTDPDPDIRYELCYALAERAAPVDDPVFRAGLTDPDVRVRCWALNGLGHLHDPAALPAVAAALYDPIYNIRYRAVWALGQIGTRAAVPPLTALLDREQHIYVRYYAAEALARIQAEGGK